MKRPRHWPDNHEYALVDVMVTGVRIVGNRIVDYHDETKYRLARAAVCTHRRVSAYQNAMRRRGAGRHRERP